MTITKAGNVGSNESFIFDVKNNRTGEVTTVVINGNGSVKLSRLPIGDTYVVTENGDWSWRYETTTYADSDNTNAAGTVTIKDDGNTVTVTNTKTEDKWLSDESFEVNEFNKTK